MRYEDYDDLKNYIQELDDEEILMTLDKRSKTGTIGKINLKSVGVIALTLGSVGLFSITSILGKKTNNYASSVDYSSQVESMFDVSVDLDQSEILDGMNKQLELIEEYENAESDKDKLDTLKKMDESRLTVCFDALNLVKMKLAKEHGGDYTQYTIYFNDDEANMGYFYEKTQLDGYDQEKVYESGKVDEKFYDTTTDNYLSTTDKLKNGNFDLDNLGSDANKFAKLYKQVVAGAGDFIGKTADKAK